MYRFIAVISIFSAIIIFEPLAFGFLLSPGAEEDSREALLEEVNRKIAVTRRELQRIQEERARQEELLKVLQSHYDSIKSRMTAQEKEIEEIKTSRARIEAELEKTRKELVEKEELIRARLKAIYKRRNLHSIRMLLDSRDVSTFLSRYKYLGKIIRTDARMIEEIGESISRIEAQQKALAAKSAQLSETSAEHSRSKSELAKKQKEITAILKELYRTEILLMKDLDDYQKQKEYLEKEIKQIMARARQKSLQEETAVDETRAAGSDKQGGKTEKKTSVDPSTLDFIWPIGDGDRVIAFYGKQVDPVYNVSYFNSGIDIAAQPGESVRAVAAGKVMYRGELRNIGKVVIIDHGGDVATLYSHLGQIDVGTGQRVSQGEVIGRAAPGKDNGPSFVHFEVRIGGASKDPMNWL